MGTIPSRTQFVVIVISTLDHDYLVKAMTKLTQNLNTVPLVLKQKKVEGRLKETLKSLAGTEGNIVLLNTLKSKNLATHDVRNFIEKQRIHKRVNKMADTRVMRSAMHSKLVDVLAHAKRLRQSKNVLKQKLVKLCATKSQGNRIIKNLDSLCYLRHK